MEPEQFISRLHHSLGTGELTIECLRAPSLSQVCKLSLLPVIAASPVPVRVAASLVLAAAPPHRPMGIVRPPPVHVKPPLTRDSPDDSFASASLNILESDTVLMLMNTF